MSWWAAPIMTGALSRPTPSSSTAPPAPSSRPSTTLGSSMRPGTTPATTTTTWGPETCPPARFSESSTPGPGCGCKTYRRTATRTASRSIRSTITSSCRCPRAAPIARPSSPMVAWVCMQRSELPDQRLLIAHHLPVAAALGPQFADEHPAEPKRRAFRELHAALVGDEGIVGSERLHLKELQQVVGVHAVFDFA